MRISVVIIISFAANVVLALVLFRNTQGGPLSGSGGMESENPAANAINAATDSAAGSQNESSAAARVTWRDLQAQDMKEFVRKLRAVNCPEETIKDLVLAELNRRYSKKTSALWQPQADLNNYWKPYQRNIDPAEQKKNRERSRQMQDLNKEKTALIVELFGVDVEKERLKEEGLDYEGWNPYGSLTFLPEAKRAAVQKYLDDFQEKEQEFYASTRGGWDAAARAKQKQLEQEKMDGLAQLLTPDELREYELRNSQMATQVSSELHGVDLTREQYEALFDLRQKYGDSIYNYGDAGNSQDAIKQIEQNKKDLQAEIADALGTDKASELERAGDYSYQQLASLARHNDLPADTAPKIYDYKQAAEKAVETLNANQDLAPEQRQAALQQIRSETEQSIKTSLGDTLYKRYLNNGGWWINNLAPAARNRP